MTAAEVVFESHGVAVGIVLPNSVDSAEVRGELPPGWTTQQSTTCPEHRFRVGGEWPCGASASFCYEGTEEIEELLRRARPPRLGDALDLVVSVSSPERLFVHAGAVGWRGRAVLLPGPSQVGKSTLVEALVHRGARYLSDEFAVLDRVGRAHSYARPVRPRRSDGSRDEWQPPAVAVPEGPLPVGAVVCTSYRRGGSWRPDSISPGAGLLALVANTVAARKRPAAALDMLSKVVSTAVIWKSDRGASEGTAERILASLDRAWKVSPRSAAESTADPGAER